MVEATRRPCFGKETLANVLVRMHGCGQKFECNMALQALIKCPVYDAHATFTDLFDNAIGADLVASPNTHGTR